MNLKECPFCGGTEFIWGGQKSMIYIFCCNCEMCAFKAYSLKKEDTAEGWNKRHPINKGDQPDDAGENCFFRGGHGCNNIRLGVPWKTSGE